MLILEQPKLHLIDAAGTDVSPLVREAVETAYRWVVRDYPNVDSSRIADWAESLGASMQARGSAISSPKRFAYPALRGKVLDWMRTGVAKEESSGVGEDLERLGIANASFQEAVDRKILFEQLKEVLTERDRDILVLLLNEKSTQEVAKELKTSEPAARKAIQRVRERSRAILDGIPESRAEAAAKQNAEKGRGLAVERKAPERFPA